MRATGHIAALAAVTLIAGATGARAVDTGRSFPGPDRSPDGLELADFTVTVIGTAPHVGQYATVRFRLTNVGTKPIALGGSGVFVAVRWDRPGQPGGREEGFRQKNKTLEPGETVSFKELVDLDGVGRWSFSPGYALVRGSSPFPWHALELDVVEAPREVRRLGYCANVETLPGGIALLGFSVFGPTPIRDGDEVTIEYHLQNRAQAHATVVFGPRGVFAVASVGGQERAFGAQLAGGSLAPDRADRVLPVEARLRLDAPGEWRFRPVVDLNGRQTPTNWCEVTVQVGPK
jgi:hypothetical protein